MSCLLNVFRRGHERGSVLAISNLPFDEWTEVFGSGWLAGALFNRLTHHVDILGMNEDNYLCKLFKPRSHTHDCCFARRSIQR